MPREVLEQVRAAGRRGLPGDRPHRHPSRRLRPGSAPKTGFDRLGREDRRERFDAAASSQLSRPARSARPAAGLDRRVRSRSAPHLHICAQAGDDGILKAMRRNYDTAYYRDLLARVRERLPDAALGQRHHRRLSRRERRRSSRARWNILPTLPLTYFHVFPYSDAARHGGGDVAGCGAGARSRKAARATHARARRRKRTGVLRRIYRPDAWPCWWKRRSIRRPALCRGFSRNYLPVTLAGAGVPPTEKSTVRLERIPKRLAARPCDYRARRRLSDNRSRHRCA